MTRPSMRFVAVKSEACSSVLVLHRTRDFLVRQRTQIGNAIRAHMTEFGVIVAKGAQNVDRLRAQLEQLPEAARLPVALLFEQLADTNTRIQRFDGRDRGNPCRERGEPASGDHSLASVCCRDDHRSDDARRLATSTAPGTMPRGSA